MLANWSCVATSTGGPSHFLAPVLIVFACLQAYRKFTDMSREQIITRMKDDLGGGAQQSYYLTVNRDKKYAPLPLMR